MDHKVSKDMISSGMIPSGEKTQADLGRTQYGSAPSPSSLMEAYRSIYEHHQKDADGKVIEHGEKEELSEMRVKGGGVSTSLPKKKANQKVVDKLTGYQQTQKGVGAASLIPDSAFSNPNPRRTTRNEMYGGGAGTTPKPNSNTTAKKPGLIQRMKNRTAATNTAINQMNDVDLFDLVKGKLIDEGCDEQEAIKIMVNMSEEELNEISEGVGAALLGGALATGLAIKGIQTYNKMKNDAKKRDPNTVGGKLQSVTDAKNKALRDAGM